jgi:phage gpG-like protein
MAGSSFGAKFGKGGIKVEGLDLYLDPELMRARCAEALWNAAYFTAVKARSYIGHQQPSWPPLQEATSDTKARLGFGTGPLERSGELKNSIGAAVQPDILTAEVYSDSPYSAIHEYGGTTDGGRGGTQNIPPRPFLGPASVWGEALLLEQLEAIAVDTAGLRPVSRGSSGSDDMSSSESASNTATAEANKSFEGGSRAPRIIRFKPRNK